ncbi:hypothetical protein BDY21DRAFT_310987 [Lineolata rhizophorae]|uniref:Copper acquisition factor BIM1-like domain-containing protein n=1 Tax=Lineolata rhizophorae TaxID=578093 RepID=A0A6A6NPJ2_9PEZI|nr:hypothetical protein BDY21DRAFT_310987 [Lineolata rhizophorae]
MPSPTTVLSVLLLLAPLLASAHFHITYPGSRGFSEEDIFDYPCGGFPSPMAERVPFPLSGGPIQIDNEHTESLLQVTMALGNDPSGDDFVFDVVPTVQEYGPAEFCFGDVRAPADVAVRAGENATFQVITSGHEGGLYACVDVTFTDTPLSSSEYDSHCENATGVSVEAVEPGTMANMSAHDHGDGDGDGDGDEEGGEAAASSTSTGGAPAATWVGWAVGAVGVVGGLAVL